MFPTVLSRKYYWYGELEIPKIKFDFLTQSVFLWYWENLILLSVHALETASALNLDCLCLGMTVMLKDDNFLLAQKQVLNSQCSPQTPSY